MRYYFITEDKNEYILNLSNSKRVNANLIHFSFERFEDNKKSMAHIYLRDLAGKLYASSDQKSWKKVAKTGLVKSLLNTNQHVQLLRGFRPSGFGGAEAGELVTQMPGKVVKILVKEGQDVSEGETLLILEAMKMENEFKSRLDGKVINILVKEGQTVETGVVMIEME